MKAPESFAEFLALPDAERERLVKSMSARSEPKPSPDQHVVDRSQEPLVLRSCSLCNWTNVSLINLGEPNKPRMVCQGCCKRAVEAMDAVLAITQNAAGQGRREATYPEPACSQGGCQ